LIPVFFFIAVEFFSFFSKQAQQAQQPWMQPQAQQQVSLISLNNKALIEP